VQGDSWQKEQFSQSYVLAVAAHAKTTINNWNVDKDGVDLTLRRRGIMVDVQLKCTGSPRVVQDDFVFDLDVPTYDKLRDPDRSAPAYLSLLIVPKDLQDWLCHEPEQLLVRCHGYWASMVNRPEPQGSATVADRLPRAQRLDSAALDMMFEESRRWSRQGPGAGGRP